MLKMKLISLLRNSKVRISLIILAVALTIVTIIAWPVSEADTQINVEFRATGMGVKVGGKNIEIPEVSPNQNNQAAKNAKYNNTYCIDEGTSLSSATYNKEMNLYNSSESKQYFKNYNSMIWVVDNMYISTSDNPTESLEYFCSLLTSPEVKDNVSSYGDITAEQIKALNKTVGNGSDKYGNTINRNLLEVVEQLVIWNYTNNKNNSDELKYDKLVNGGFVGSGITDSDQNACKYVYYGLKYLANQNSSYTSDGNTSNVVSLDTSNAKINLSQSQVGPYYLRADGIVLGIDNIKSKISGTIANANGEATEINSDRIKSNQDGSFYIDISGISNVAKATLEALKSQKTPEHIAELRGKKVEEL